MKTLLAVTFLAVAASAHAEPPPLLSEDDIARIIAARSAERVHCANVVTQQIDAERRACEAERRACEARGSACPQAAADAPSCATLRKDEYDAMGLVRLSAGGLLEGQEDFALGVMARSGCPGIFTLSRPQGPLIIERTPWRRDPSQPYNEQFSAVEPVRREGMGPQDPSRGRSGDDILNDIQARVEGLLGIDVTPHLRCGLSAYEVHRFRVDSRGIIRYSNDEDAFLGCTFRVTNP